jgi:hypothetical protein
MIHSFAETRRHVHCVSNFAMSLSFNDRKRGIFASVSDLRCITIAHYTEPDVAY